MRVDVGDLVGLLAAAGREAGSSRRGHGWKRAIGLGQGRADREVRASRDDVFGRTLFFDFRPRAEAVEADELREAIDVRVLLGVSLSCAAYCEEEQTFLQSRGIAVESGTLTPDLREYRSASLAL